jgi:hypothetical protein
LRDGASSINRGIRKFQRLRYKNVPLEMWSSASKKKTGQQMNMPEKKTYGLKTEKC